VRGDRFPDALLDRAADAGAHGGCNRDSGGVDGPRADSRAGAHRRAPFDVGRTTRPLRASSTISSSAPASQAARSVSRKRQRREPGSRRCGISRRRVSSWTFRVEQRSRAATSSTSRYGLALTPAGPPRGGRLALGLELVSDASCSLMFLSKEQLAELRRQRPGTRIGLSLPLGCQTLRVPVVPLDEDLQVVDVVDRPARPGYRTWKHKLEAVTK
jgi:hypothetical protein